MRPARSRTDDTDHLTRPPTAVSRTTHRAGSPAARTPRQAASSTDRRPGALRFFVGLTAFFGFFFCSFSAAGFVGAAEGEAGVVIAAGGAAEGRGARSVDSNRTSRLPVSATDAAAPPITTSHPRRGSARHRSRTSSYSRSRNVPASGTSASGRARSASRTASTARARSPSKSSAYSTSSGPYTLQTWPTAPGRCFWSASTSRKSSFSGGVLGLGTTGV